MWRSFGWPQLEVLRHSVSLAYLQILLEFWAAQVALNWRTLWPMWRCPSCKLLLLLLLRPFEPQRILSIHDRQMIFVYNKDILSLAVDATAAVRKSELSECFQIKLYCRIRRNLYVHERRLRACQRSYVRWRRASRPTETDDRSPVQ